MHCAKLGKDIVTFSLVGDVHSLDVKKIEPLMDEVYKENHYINLVVDVSKATKIEPKAFRQDFMEQLKYHDKVKKVAIVGLKLHMEWFIELTKVISHVDMKFFEQNEMKEAEHWAHGSMGKGCCS